MDGESKLFVSQSVMLGSRKKDQDMNKVLNISIAIVLLAGATVLANCHHGWFVQHDALTACIDKGVGSTQVDGQVVRKHPA